MNCCKQENPYQGIIDSLKDLFSDQQLIALNEACVEGRMQAVIVPKGISRTVQPLSESDSEELDYYPYEKHFKQS